MLDLQEALSILNTGQWCNIAYVSYDTKKQRFGEIIRLPKCRVANRVNSSEKTSKIADETISRLPNHSEHFTKNVTLPSGQVRKVHLRLLFSINNNRIL